MSGCFFLKHGVVSYFYEKFILTATVHDSQINRIDLILEDATAVQRWLYVWRYKQHQSRQRTRL